MEYNQEGEEIREDRKINLRKFLIVSLGLLITGTLLVAVQKVTHIYILLYIWPLILAIISVGAVAAVLKRNKEDEDQ
ncbi:hypothetical protein BH11PAT2_BH11PAT2_03590 [soil metagenome]